ncbi:hypothetical protein [Variovorax sp. GT1P44]|uniref:hypothetical protein n=1 Tax=Variovorax sp. GT1P44 TaxID=3443742 RepID=UPI003F44A032
MNALARLSGRWLRGPLVALVLGALAGSALACAMCLSAFKVTMSAQELAYAQRIVLVRPEGSAYRVVDVVKGGVAVNALIDEHVARVDAAAAASPKPLLLIREDRWVQWVNMGPIGAEQAQWLRQLAAGGPARLLTRPQQQARVAFLLPSLESPDAMVAEIAYGEIAGTDYGAMRAVKAGIDVRAVRRWLADPKLEDRRDLYYLLLGLSGDAGDADVLERRIDALWKARDATNLASLLAADLELRGPSRVDWIERRYLLDRQRSLEEQRAAVLALGEMGTDDSAVPRARVVDTYRRLIARRSPTAGLAAGDLAQWQMWDFAPEYVALLKADAPMSPHAQLTILGYLRRNPRPEAKAGVAWVESRVKP